MKQPIKHSTILFLFVVMTTLLGISIAGAQGGNLLTNPGFENPYRVVSEGRNVAEGWQPWNLEPGANSPSYENVQPIYEPASPDTTRIRSGENAQKYFTDLYFTHVGGVFQRVTGIDPGAELRFSVYAYVWSSNQDDVDISEDPGGVTIEVGIDPTGGTDPTSADIDWSVAVEQYDAYRQYSVIAEATSNAVTVFVRSSVDFPQRNNFVYLDDAVLEVTPDSVSQQPTSTTAPTNTSVPEATSTPTLIPTNTPESSTGDDPTPTQEGGDTQPPTNTAIPTAAPLPTDVPLATATTVPSGGPVGGDFSNTLIHTVQRGDTVGRLAVLYGSTVEAIIAANNLDANALIFVGQGLIIPVRLAAPATSTPTATPQVIVVTATPQFGTGGPGVAYLVRPGDTLSSIARAFNTSVAALAQANGIVNPNRILAGQTLIIPGTGGPHVVPTSPPTAPQPQAYIVQPGDNLYRISLRFGVTMAALANANNIINVNRIFAGQTLIIP